MHHASDDSAHGGSTTARAHHGHHGHKKQFVVSTRHGHGHAHNRVPSYGRNLNKLAGQGGSSSRLHQHATPPKGEKEASEKKKQRRQGAKFEIGSSDDEVEEVEDEEMEEVIEEEIPPRQQQQRAGSRSRGNRDEVDAGKELKKSSSTKSLERRERRERSEKKIKERGQSGERERRERKRRSAELSNGQVDGAVNGAALPPQQVKQHQEKEKEPVPHQPTTNNYPKRAPPHFQPNTHARPLSPQESGGPVTATNITTSAHTSHNHNHSRTPHTPVTPAHSLPSSQEQPLTSRFMHASPSSAAESAVRRRAEALSRTPPSRSAQQSNTASKSARSESAHSISKPTSASSRTQKKLWLQRQSSQQEVPENMLSGVSSSASPGEYYILQARMQREFERVGKEYMNVRRFKNPVGDGLDRIRDKPGQQRRIIPRRTTSGGDAPIAGSLGLSQSLKEAGEIRKHGARTAQGLSRDDAGVQEGRKGDDRQSEVEQILKILWKRGEILESNE